MTVNWKIILVLFFFQFNLYSQDKIKNISEYYFLLNSDPEIAEILEQKIPWVSDSRSNPSFGFRNSAVWGYIEFFSPISYNPSYLIFENPLLDDIVVYYKRSSSSNEMVKIKGGNLVDLSQRPFPYRLHVFPVKASKENSRIYFRIKSSDSLVLTATILSRNDFLARVFLDNLFLGLYFGFVLLIFLYNIFMYIKLHDRNSLYYAGLTFFIGILQAANHGLFFYYLFSGKIQSHQILMAIAGNGWNLFAVLLVTSFLEKYNKDILYKFIVIISVFIMLLTIWNYEFINISMMWSMIVVFYCLIITLKDYQKSLYLKYFTFGILANMIGLFSYGIKGINIYQVAISIEGMMYVHVIELVLISFSLSLKIKNMERSHDLVSSENQKLIHQLKIQELKEKKERLSSLIKIIQPHFMLNSLNTIIRKILNNPEEAVDIIQLLTKELKYIKNYSNSQLVKLNEEILVCKNHLNIMESINRKKYSLKEDIKDENIWIPPLILHTILENSLTHEDLDSSGFEFRISTSNQQDLIDPQITKREICVEANGNFNKKLSINSGVGTFYIESRLEESFPGQWQFNSESISTGWRSVIIIRK